MPFHGEGAEDREGLTISKIDHFSVSSVLSVTVTQFLKNKANRFLPQVVLAF